MKATNLICAFSLIAAFALVSCGKADQTSTNNPSPDKTTSSASPGFDDPSKLTAQAPETFKAQFDTTKGKFTVEVTRSLAPNGADRFYNLVAPVTSRTLRSSA